MWGDVTTEFPSENVAYCLFPQRKEKLEFDIFLTFTLNLKKLHACRNVEIEATHVI